MIKIVFCLKRRPELTRQMFQTYWRDSHGQLVRERAALLGIRRYVQSHSLSDPRLAALAEPRGSAGQDYDGVAELWFDDLEALVGNPALAAEAARRAALELLEDEARFIDLAASPIFVVEEHEVVAPGERV